MNFSALAMERPKFPWKWLALEVATERFINVINVGAERWAAAASLPSQVKLGLLKEANPSPEPVIFPGEFLPQRQLTHISCQFAFHLICISPNAEQNWFDWDKGCPRHCCWNSTVNTPRLSTSLFSSSSSLQILNVSALRDFSTDGKISLHKYQISCLDRSWIMGSFD